MRFTHLVFGVIEDDCDAPPLWVALLGVLAGGVFEFFCTHGLLDLVIVETVMQFALFADEAGGAIGFILIALLWVLGFLLYIAPSIIAFTRGHPNAVPILLINVFLGWICLAGWFWALVWAFTNPHAPGTTVIIEDRQRRRRRRDEDDYDD